MSVSGGIEHGELLTALRLLSRGRRTGALLVSTSFATAAVGFEDGGIVSASSAMSRKLGEVLVEKGLVKRDRLDAALWVQRQDKEWRPIGRVLVDVKVLPEDVVALALEEQVVRVLDDILRWDHGTFRFEERPPAGGDPVRSACGDLGKLELKIALRPSAQAVPAP
jgi:hypothetical protein